MNKKIYLALFGMIFIGAFLLNFVSAEFWACFQEGEIVNYCNDYRDSKTYVGSHPLCMSIYREAENCYVHGTWAKCNALDPADCRTNTGGTTNFDLTPPEFEILSPINNTLYNSRSIYLAFSLDEKADVYYRDLTSTSVYWKRICTGCSPGDVAYNRSRSFAEGENNLIFKAVDVMKNEAYVSLTFLVDSIKPRIYRTGPRSNGFADGNFEAQFKESNPKKLTLHYGIDSAEVDLDECYESSYKKMCNIEVDLDEYNGEKIPYYFEIEDISGNKYSSRATNVFVDTEPPKVKNEDSFYDINGRYVEFNLSIDEDNLYKVSMLKTYTSTYGPRTITTTLCTRLTNGYCYKKQSFAAGDYDLSIQITDKAGHSIAIPVEFTISY